jgi:hypothetical protein
MDGWTDDEHKKKALDALRQIVEEKYFERINESHRILTIGADFIRRKGRKGKPSRGPPRILVRSVELEQGNFYSRKISLSEQMKKYPLVYRSEIPPV